MINVIEISEKIEEINETLNLKATPDSLDNLYNNLGGIALFRHHYALYKNISEEDALLETFEYFFEKMLFQRTYDMSFAWGLSGIAWLLHFLQKRTAIDVAPEIFEIIDENLLPAILTCSRNKDYELFSGLIGINQYLTKRNTSIARSLMLKINDEILSICETDKGRFIYFDGFHPEKSEGKKIINLGISHGMTSLIHYFIVSIQNNINTPKCTFHLRHILKTIEEYKDIKGSAYRTTKSIYPLHIEKQLSSNEEIIRGDSRLAWCYGDLGIGFLQYKAGIFLNMPGIITSGLEILSATTLRRAPEQTLVTDYGLCHGTAGLAHIYNKLWRTTKEPIFKEAAEHWMASTLNYLAHTDELISAPSKSSYGLLNGLSGVGLALLGFLTNDAAWDECLMLDLPTQYSRRTA